uniref:BAAT/Acyl-CoA thioester hydrolase C-terminal domain-containing protein n=1 Tax=Biomphalaria glabrata TaxID=6526 RepID=A0A2C9LAA5_BIOGL
MFGSRGGLTEYKGALLASHGMAVLCLPYFMYKDLPTNMMEMDLDYFEAAVNWLLRQPKVSTKGLGVVAISKGVENAMAMGAYLPQVTAVVCVNGFPFMTISDLVSKGQVLLKGAQNKKQLLVRKKSFTDFAVQMNITGNIISMIKQQFINHNTFVLNLTSVSYYS